MKRLLMLTILVTISLTTSLYAQKKAQKLDESIQMEGEAYTKKYKVEVTEESTLRINIKGKIKDGTVLVNIYNPDGKKHNSLSLDASIGQSTAKGSINETGDNPIPGTWVIEVVNKRSIGEMKLMMQSN